MSKTKQRQRGFLQQLLRKTMFSAIEHEVAKSAAALTYYLLFAMFPLLIFISNLLGMLDLNVTSISTALLPILPDDVVYLLEAYLTHVTKNSSPVIFWFSLVFTVWFPMRAVRGLMNNVRLAYHLDKPTKPMLYIVRQLIFPIIFLVVIILVLLLAILGRRFLMTVIQWLETGALLQIPSMDLVVWQYLRFVLLAVMMFGVLALLYAASQDKRQPAKTIVPGAAVALVVWLLLSIGFSLYVENFANYSVIYGTLGAVIVLLVWLYMTSFILILGAEFNAALIAVRRERAALSESASAS